MQKGLTIIRESNLGKGYNNKLPPEHIPEGYMADILNGVITEDKIEKRTGYTITGDDTGNKKILGLFGITTSVGTKRLYKFHDNAGGTGIRILEWTGTGNWTEIDSGTLLTNVGEPVNCVAAENVVYAYDGLSVPVVITPGSPSTVAAVPDANHPKGKFGVWFHNFHFVAGVTSAKSTLSWSELEDSDDFTNTTTGNVKVNPDDGDEITGLAVLKDELFVFKRNRIWSLTGFGTSGFTLNDVNERLTNFGSLSHRGIINTGNDLNYLSFTGGIPEIRSLTRTRYGTIVEGGIISDPIEGTMKALSNGLLDEVCGTFDGRRLFMAVPSTGAATNDTVLVYDTVLKGWVRWTGLYPSVFTEFDFSNTSEIYFGEARADSKVYKKDTSTSDNGTAISFRVDTRRYGGERPEVQKKWKYLYATLDAVGDYDLTLQYSTDGFTFDSFATINMKNPGAVFDDIVLDTSRLGSSDILKKRLEYAKKTGYFHQLRFIQNGLDEEASLRDCDVLFKYRGLRDA